MEQSAAHSKINGRFNAEYIARHLGKFTSSGARWMAQCPAHGDRTPSLSITDAEDGKILVKCFAGCTQDAVIAALKARGLWPQSNGNNRPTGIHPIDIEQIRQQTKRKYPGNTPDLGWAKMTDKYNYTDERGKLLYQKGRWEWPDSEGQRQKTFRFRRPDGRNWISGMGGARPVPYRLDKIIDAPTVYIVEGEKDVHTLEQIGLAATTSYSSNWDEKWSPLFKGKRVILLPDNDAVGRRYVHMVSQSITAFAEKCKTVYLPNLAEKGDITDWMEAGGTAADLEKLVAAVPWDRPSVCVNAPKRDTVVKECIQALRQRNESTPVLFARGHSMVYVANDKRGRASIAEVQESYLLGEMERAADFYRDVKKGQSDAWPPPALASAILARPQAEWGFPALDGVVTGPVLRKDWSVMVEPGYDPSLCLYYAPPSRLKLPEISDKPTQEQCREAVAVIDDVIGEFPWVSAADRANYMALLLSPLVRHRLDSSVPIALLDSPKKGNGKTLLAEILGIVHEGEEPFLWTPPTGDNWEKIITTILLSGQPITVFDNLECTLNSPVLSKVVTANAHADRQFHTQKRLVMRNSTLFIVTGNNIKLAGDIGRRCYQIRLDAKSPRPWERKKFKHPFLKSHASQQRGAILAALLTMTRGWVAADKPPLPTEELGGGFEGWSRIVGRILAYAGVGGFLANQDRLYEESDVSEGQWANFLAALLEGYPQGFKIGKLVEDLPGCVFPKDVLPDEPEFAAKRNDYDTRKIAGIFRRRLHTRYGPRGLYLDKKDKEGAAALWYVRAAAGRGVETTAKRLSSCQNP